MKQTRIVCPACEMDHLDYSRPGKRSESPQWHCLNCLTTFYSSGLVSRFRRKGIFIDSVNYPYRLHITAEGVTAG